MTSLLRGATDRTLPAAVFRFTRTVYMCIRVGKRTVILSQQSERGNRSNADKCVTSDGAPHWCSLLGHRWAIGGPLVGHRRAIPQPL